MQHTAFKELAFSHIALGNKEHRPVRELQDTRMQVLILALWYEVALVQSVK